VLFLCCFILREEVGFKMKKTQVAMEYLVIVGLVLVILIPIIALYVRYTGETDYAVTSAKVDHIAGEISKAANSVYFYGADSQTSVDVDFPSGVTSLEFLTEGDNHEIVFTINTPSGGTSELAVATEFEMVDLSGSGQIPVAPGRKKIIVKSLGDTVAVSIPCDSTDPPICSQDFPDCGSGGCLLDCSNFIWEIDQQCTYGCVDGSCYVPPCSGDPDSTECSVYQFSESDCNKVEGCIWITNPKWDHCNNEGGPLTCFIQDGDSCTMIGCTWT